MARPLRFEYPGAVCHLMARGDGGKCIFPGKEDHLSFLHWLAQVCGSHGWRVQARHQGPATWALSLSDCWRVYPAGQPLRPT